MSPRGLNVFVNIGARVLGSVNSAASTVEKRFGAMGRGIRVHQAEMKAMSRDMANSNREMAALMMGAGAFKGLKGSWDAGKEYVHQVEMLKQAGRSSSEIASGIAAANDTMKQLPTSILSENLKVLNETTLAYGNFGHAMENLTFNQKMGGMLQNMLGDKMGDPGTVFQNLIRAAEIRGTAMDKARYQRETGAMFQAMIASGGTVNPEEILGFTQQANPAVRSFSERYMTRIVPSLIQEFGGERAGTASTAFFNQILGRVPVGGKALTQEWIRLGLVPKAGSGGNLSRTGWSAGSMKGTNLAMSDPLAWSEAVLLPAMKAKGIDINDSRAILLETKKLFGRETGARIANTLLDPKQRQRLHKDEALYSKALGPDAAYGDALRNDPKMATAAAMAAVKNLETAIGRAITPAMIVGLKGFAQGVNWLAGAITAHPGIGKALGTMFAGIIGLSAFRFAQLGWQFLGVGKGLGFIWRALVGSGKAIRGAVLAAEMMTSVYAPAMSAATGGVVALAGVLMNVLAPALAAVAFGISVKRAGDFNNTLKNPGAATPEELASAKAYAGQQAGWYKGQLAKDPNNPAFKRNYERFHAAEGTLAGAPAHRAGGGSVRRGGLYEINERGRELFVPGRSGTVIPARATAALIAALSGGIPMAAAAQPASFNPTVIVQGAHDPLAVAREVERVLVRLAREQRGSLSD